METQDGAAAPTPSPLQVLQSQHQQHHQHQQQPKSKPLLPDYLDDETKNSSKTSDNSSDYIITQSFRDIRRKTLRSLYGIDTSTCSNNVSKTKTKNKNKNNPKSKAAAIDEVIINHELLMDKSPKGSVDEAIRSLVDLVNAHPSYATLSSCSGRISLFDPMALSNKCDCTSTSASTSTSPATLGGASKKEVEEEEDGGVVKNERNGISYDNTTANDNDNNNNNNDDDDNDNSNINSGKGYGSWLIASHATITPNQLITELDAHAKSRSQSRPNGTNTNTNSHCDYNYNYDYALMFKHEPLLLHIAASNMCRARQLLTIACNLGFRESGLVVTPKRITVAIRSHSLSLAVPIASSGGLRPSDEYIHGLVKEANDRFRLNEKKLIALEEEVRANLFQSQVSLSSSSSPSLSSSSSSSPSPQSGDTVERSTSNKSFHMRGSPLPDLNLWGHSAVCVPTGEMSHSDDAEIIVFGGYGAGPAIVDVSSQKQKQHQKQKRTMHCARSNKVFSLKRRDKIWDECWKELKQKEVSNENVEEMQHFGLKLQHASFSAREGHSSCILPLDKLKFSSDLDQIAPLVATFGGRAGPSRPNNDLLLMIPSRCYQDTISFFTPIDVQGHCPSPRWGHSFTALSGIGGRVGVVVGGRDEKNVLDSIHVLSCFCEANSSGLQKKYFQWDRIDVLKSIPRFHHSAVLASSSEEGKDDQDEIIIFGGMRSLNLFHDTSDSEDTTSTSLVITLRKNHSCSVESINSNDASLSVFGGAACLVSSNDRNEKANLIFRCGGLSSCNETSEETIASFGIHTFGRKRTGPIIYSADCEIEERIDFGSLIHHVMVELPFIEKGNLNFASLGGGAQSFAFGQSFAKSYELCIEQQEDRVKSKKQRGKNQPADKQIRSNSNTTIPLVKSSGKVSDSTDVLYVKNRKAKEVKVALQELGFLDRNFRMTKADSSAPFDDARNFIAIPVTKVCMETIATGQCDNSSTSWQSQVEDSGIQDMPYSTVVLGRK